MAWGLHLYFRHRGHDLRDRYRDLAWESARSGGVGERVDPGFDYFERLSAWSRSGAWDADPGAPGLQPETDPRTFNGSVWERARALHAGAGEDPGSPGYARALEYYRERAYGPRLLWDWTGRERSLAEYRGLIDDSDDRLRSATHMLGIVLANHLASGVDAFVSARLRNARLLTTVTPGAPGRPPRLEWRIRVLP